MSGGQILAAAGPGQHTHNREAPKNQPAQYPKSRGIFVSKNCVAPVFERHKTAVPPHTIRARICRCVSFCRPAHDRTTREIFVSFVFISRRRDVDGCLLPFYFTFICLYVAASTSALQLLLLLVAAGCCYRSIYCLMFFMPVSSCI